ncbi:MAG: hypothetical protein KDB26_05235 [Microthrixaceae bacterium]|nr:hypothetical protein [Microthrixaceae bacterium]
MTDKDKTRTSPTADASGVSKIVAPDVNGLAAELDKRALTLRGLAGRSSEISSKVETKTGTDSIYAKALTAFKAAGTTFKTQLGKRATAMEGDATYLRTGVVANREQIEEDTKKKLDDAGNELVYV